MFLQKYFVLILLEVVVGSSALSGSSARIKLTAFFKKENKIEEQKNEESLSTGANSESEDTSLGGQPKIRRYWEAQQKSAPSRNKEYQAYAQRSHSLTHPDEGESGEAANEQPPGDESVAGGRKADMGSLESYRDTAYFGKIMLGTADAGKEQWFSVLIDTYSSDLWVHIRGSCVPDIHNDCSGFREFVSSRSSTFKPLEKRFTLSYGARTKLTGKLATDVLKLGSGKTQIEVPEMLFGLGENYLTKVDGIMGLGFQGSRYPGIQTTPFQDMVNQANILPQFGILLNRKIDGEDMGELVLGGHEEDLIEEDFTIINVETTDSAYTNWLFKLDGISVGDHPIDYNVDVRASADSGTSTIVVPLTVANQINMAVWGSDSANWKRIFVCNTVHIDELPNITFKIKNKAFVLKPEEYISRIPEALFSEEAKRLSKEGPICMFGFRDIIKQDRIILGQAFMRVYYTKFDWKKKEIGFARTKRS